jgi:thiamine pyrophosphokinase
MRVVVVVAPGAAAIGPLPEGAVVIAVDGGADAVVAVGLRVDVAVGDFDSISPRTLALLEAQGTRIERHPAKKDATDLELALDAALALAPERVLLIAGAGGRLDHLVSILLLLGAPKYADVKLDARLDSATVHVVRSERTLDGVPGETISLFALNGPATDVTATGLVYPLAGETLQPGSSRGCSNFFSEREAMITVGSGVVLVVRPGSEPGGGGSSSRSTR